MQMKMLLVSIFSFGGLICLVNFYLSFLRGPLHQLFAKEKTEYSWVSGFPFLGTLLVLGSGFFLKEYQPILVLGVMLILVDTGGPHWFLGAMLYESRKAKNKI